MASASLNCRWREDEEADTDADVGPGLLPVALAASSSPVGGIILVGFVEVGAVVVAAVRLAAVAMAESDVPEVSQSGFSLSLSLSLSPKLMLFFVTA